MLGLSRLIFVLFFWSRSRICIKICFCECHLLGSNAPAMPRNRLKIREIIFRCIVSPKGILEKVKVSLLPLCSVYFSKLAWKTFAGLRFKNRKKLFSNLAFSAENLHLYNIFACRKIWCFVFAFGVRILSIIPIISINTVERILWWYQLKTSIGVIGVIRLVILEEIWTIITEILFEH